MLTASEEWNKRGAMGPKRAGGRAEIKKMKTVETAREQGKQSRDSALATVSMLQDVYGNKETPSGGDDTDPRNAEAWRELIKE